MKYMLSVLCLFFYALAYFRYVPVYTVLLNLLVKIILPDRLKVTLIQTMHYLSQLNLYLTQSLGNANLTNT